MFNIFKKKNNIVIYTAIYGEYDEIVEQPKLKDVDFILFTDNKEYLNKKTMWKIVTLDKFNKFSSRMKSKYPKLMAHEVLDTKYKYSIWIDGNMLIKNKRFVKDHLQTLTENKIALYIHNDISPRACIYEEAEYCKDFPKYKNQPIMEQVKSYRKEGFPEKNGLWAGGIIVRDMRNLNVIKINENWWQENLKWTYQDQLSLPYVLWKLNLKCDTINKDIFNNNEIEIVNRNHNTEL